MTYFANYRPQIIDFTGQNQEWHVTDQLSKFELDQTVNESEKSILLQLRRLEKNIIVQRPSHSLNDHRHFQNMKNNVKQHSFMNL